MRHGGGSLRARLIALLLATLAPLVGLGVYGVLRQARQERDHFEREGRQAAARIAAQVGDVLGDVQGMLSTLARLPAVERQDGAELDRLFGEILAGWPGLENLAAFSSDGRLFAAGPGAPRAPVVVADRRWFQAVVRAGRPVASGFLIGRISGKPVAVLAQPVRTGRGQLLGVVSAGLQLSVVSRERPPLELGVPSVWAVVDGEGLVLLQSDTGHGIGKPLGALPGMLRAEAMVRGTQWRAVVGIPHAVINASVRSTLVSIGLPAFLILLGATVAGFWMARNTWRPLQELATAVRRIGTGEREVQLPVEGGGEVEEVATALRDALGVVAAREGDLARRNTELAALVDATQAIASSLDLERILQAIVHQAAAISAAPIVRLFLLDEERQQLLYRMGMGLPPEVEQGLVIPVGQSFSGQVAATGQPLAVADCRGDPRLRYPEHAIKYGLISYLGLPVKLRNRVLGVLVFNTTAPRVHSKEEVAYLSVFADQAAIALENARLHATAVRRGEELGALLRATQSVMAGLDPQATIERIIAEASRIAGTPHVKVLRVDREAQVLRLWAVAGRPSSMLEGFLMPLGTGLSGLVAASGRPLFVPDCQNDSRNPYAGQDRDLGLVTYLGIPIRIREEILGVLTFNTREPRQYAPDDLAYLTAFADQAAIAIENARLYDTIRNHAAELEARVRQRTADLEQALRVRVDFLGRMSHELRTPLNFIIGFSELLQQGIGGPLTPKQATYIDRIYGGGKRLLSLFNDILDIAQVDAGKSRLHLEPVMVGPLVQEVLGLVQVQAGRKRLRVTTALDPWVPFIVADRFKLAQILHNLVSNAVKFTPEGGSITVRTRTVMAEEHGSGGAEVPSPLPLAPPAPQQYLELAVEDTGAGIRPENLEAIFGAFYQVDGSDTRAQGGAGLGLTLVRKLVELHGGRVWAESAGPGQGARFVVRLPRLEVPKAKRILLVEDEGLIRIQMTSVLESAGFAVVQAATGAEALANMEAVAPDLMILDIMLPDMEGWEILRRVRGGEEISPLPVLVVSGLENVSMERALAQGADDFLTKPVSPRVLVDTVVRLLGQSAAASGLAGQPGTMRDG